MVLPGPLYPHADCYRPFHLSIVKRICSEETDYTNRREDIKDQLIKHKYYTVHATIGKTTQI